MHSNMKTFLAVLVIAAVAAPSHAARLLRGYGNRFAQEDDPSGYSAFNAARIISPLGTKTRSGVTPESAESSSNAAYIGVYRASTIGGNAPLSYGTVEATPDANFDRRKEVVKPRSRSAMDLGGLVKGPPNLASGNAQIPVLVTNGASVAQTYEGATAAALPEALMVNQGKRKTVVSNSMLTATTGYAPKASKAGSFAATAQPVSAMALSGAANGKIVLAQADTAVAMAQTEKVDRDAPLSKTAWQN